MTNDTEIQALLDAASKADKIEFSNCTLDVFLRITGFSMDDLSARIYVDDLYYVFAEFYYRKFKKLPHRKKFASGSNVFKEVYVKQQHHETKKQAWGIRCSKLFKQYVVKFKEENTAWQKKFKSIKNAKKAHKSRKQNRKENALVEKQISDLLSKKDSTQK